MDRKDVKGGESISYHILPTAATLLGVSMTALVLFQGVKKAVPSSLIDEMIAVDCAVFSGSAILSYLSIRKGRAIYENLADVLFFLGLGLVNAICITLVIVF